MLEYFRFPEYQRAILAALLSGIMLPEIGVLMVLERFTFAGAGITHVAFAGVTLFILLNLNPLFGALIFALTSAFIMWYLVENKGINLDASMGIIFAFFMALAVLFMSFSKGYSGEAISYLFGSVLTASRLDIELLIGVFVVIQLILIMFHRDIFLLLLNRELAEASGVNTKNIRLLLLISIALTITIGMKVLGALLVLGMAVMPAVSALKLKGSFISVIVLSALFGALTSFTGFFISLLVNTPPSATIIIVTFLFFIMVMFFFKR